LTPGAQVAAAIEILAAIDAGDRPADDVAADYFRHRRYIGAKDRAQISSHTYTVLRHRASLDWWIARCGVAIGPRNRMLSYLALIERWQREKMMTSFDGGRFRPPLLCQAEERLVRRLAGHSLYHPEMPRVAANEIPEWLEPYLQSVFGKGLEREMAALNATAPTDLRVNLLRADREIARRALAAESVCTEPTPLSPIGLRLHERVSSWRLERSARRLRRAGVNNVERRTLSGERDKWVKRHAGSFDRVFVDVPCLGTGTWRRNPDAKWRMRPEDLSELIERQQQILRSAARLVRPGGRLIYATCSVLREEDEMQAEAFLAAEPDFSAYPVARAWEETIGGASPAGEDYLRLTPARHGTDGFFVAIFERLQT